VESPRADGIHGETMQTTLHSASGGEDPAETDSRPEKSAVPQVRFSISDVAFDWDDQYDSVLELAQDQNIDISAGCLYGDCGTCLTQLLEGTVVYNHATGVQPDAGYCLPCSCRPLTSITLKA
jgi:ferredoxin